MEPSQYQLQIFVSLIVILGAAFVALICDFLKGKNELLREVTIELEARQEEQRRAQMPATRSMEPDKPGAAVEVLTETVTGGEPTAVPTPPPVIVTVEPVTVKPEAGVVKAVVPKRDWGAVLSKGAEAAKPVLQPTGQPESASPLPAGFHDSYILNRLTRGGQPVSGLVVSIGIDTNHKSDERDHDGVHKLIQSLIGSSDFACPSGRQEFLLIYPNERGASAQRRLNEIAQELWNFQLGSLGARSIAFTWGGVEVHNESIEEAIASAHDRMHETRRGRKLMSMEIRTSVALREAV